MINGVFLLSPFDPDASEGASLGFAVAPKVMTCPADQFAKVAWISGPPVFATRSYGMNASGGWVRAVRSKLTTKMAPTPCLISHATGGPWSEGFTGRIPRARSRTGMRGATRHLHGSRQFGNHFTGLKTLRSQGCAGNIWPCVCTGPPIFRWLAWWLGESFSNGPQSANQPKRPGRRQPGL